MPFVQSLGKKGLSTEKMYSEAPYTEAALVSLLAGIDTLKNGGYMKKMTNKKTIMEVFEENGYDFISKYSNLNKQYRSEYSGEEYVQKRIQLNKDLEREITENIPYLESREIKKIVIEFSREQDKMQ